MDVLVAYDIADTGGSGAIRLRRIADVCSRYGERVQLSVFECRISPERLVRMTAEIHDVIDHKRDKVRIYQFKGQIQDSRTVLGLSELHELGQPWIL